jgi:hypothetical protein
MKAIIDDVADENMDKNTRENLLDLFEAAMTSVAGTLIREAILNTRDFATARTRGCEGFELRMKKMNGNRIAWAGTFLNGNLRMDVLAHLENA